MRKTIITMKTQNKTPIRKSKSVSERVFKNCPKINGKDISLNLKTEGHESHNSCSKLCNIKSETNIRKNFWIPEDLLSNTSSDSQLIPSPKTPKQPKEVLRKSIIKLKSSQWNESVSALRDIVQISRFNPQILEKSLPSIYKGITTLLKSLRPTVARTACQVANELFMNMPSVQSPEFDELIHSLLQKTGDNNKNLMKDAFEALDSMIIHLPPSDTIRILLHRRIAGYSLAVRTAAAKLLVCVVNILGTDSTISLNEETKTRLVLAGGRFLQDGNEHIKLHGMRLLIMLNQHKDFENIVQNKLSFPVLKKVNKVIENKRAEHKYFNVN